MDQNKSSLDLTARGSDSPHLHKTVWILQREYDDGQTFPLAWFLNYNLACDALEKVRNMYLRFYLNSDERIKAWETRPCANYVPIYDPQTGMRVYDRGQWIEDKLRTLEAIIYQFAIVEHPITTDLSLFTVDDFKWYHQDDDKEENTYRLFMERMKIKNEARERYLETRKGKPSGLPG